MKKIFGVSYLHMYSGVCVRSCIPTTNPPGGAWYCSVSGGVCVCFKLTNTDIARGWAVIYPEGPYWVVGR